MYCYYLIGLQIFIRAHIYRLQALLMQSKALEILDHMLYLMKLWITIKEQESVINNYLLCMYVYMYIIMCAYIAMVDQ